MTERANGMSIGNGTMKIPFRWGSVVLGMAMGFATWQVSQGNAIYAQAWLAHGLLHTAWVRTQASGREVKPWPWANTWPLGRLSVPRLNVEQIILARASQGTSAFALGHLDSSILPGDVGNSILSVHRDTYFGFLKALKLGDILELESLRNGRWRYQVSAIYIVDKSSIFLLEPTLTRRLTLISCYPCTMTDNRRYVVVADEVERIA
jgi:sortase A